MRVFFLEGVVVGCKVDRQVGFLIIEQIRKLLAKLHLEASFLLNEPHLELGLLYANNPQDQRLHAVALIPDNNGVLLIDNILVAGSRWQLAPGVALIVGVDDDVVTVDHDLEGIAGLDVLLEEELLLVVYLALYDIVLYFVEDHVVFDVLLLQVKIEVTLVALLLGFYHDRAPLVE